MKERLNICLTQEEINILDKKAKELNLSKSAMIGKLITQELHITQEGQIRNNYTSQNQPDNWKEELRGELHLLAKKIAKSLKDEINQDKELQPSRLTILSKLKEIKEELEDLKENSQAREGYVP
jgi:hypothetical protein